MKRTILIVSALLLSASGCDKLHSLLKKDGYSSLRPPSTLMMPGTIVYRVARGSSLKLGIVCPQDVSLGAGLQPELKVSDSATSDLARKVTGTFALNVSYFKAIQAEGDFKHVKSVKLSLSNVKIYELPLSTISERQAQRGQACKDALTFADKQQYHVSMVTSALQADVTYTVELDSVASADVELKLKVMKGLAVKLGGGVEVSSEYKLSGAGLLWGLREQEELVDMSRRTDTVTRLFEPGAIVEVDEAGALADAAAPAEPAAPTEPSGQE